MEKPGAERGTMFGMPCLKHSGKAFGGVFGDSMVFKLEGAAHESALELAGAELFDPSGMGRPMKAWVVVPRAHARRWQALAEAAVLSVTPGVPTAERGKVAAKKRARVPPRGKR
jgi:hypothetical protein